MTMNDLIPWKRNEKSLAKNNGSNSLPALRDEMNQLFDTFFEDPWSLRPFEIMNNALSGFMPSMDVNETEKEIKVSLELPGMDEKDVQVSLGNGMLTISGEKKAETKEKGKGYFRSERSFGSFQRQLPITEDVDEQGTSAVFKNGVLNVTLPKRQAVNASSRRITIKKG